MVRVTVKWGKVEHVVDADLGADVSVLMGQIERLTGVPASRQKLLCRTAWKGSLKESGALGAAAPGLKDGAVVTLMGSAATVAAPAEAVRFVEDEPGSAAALGLMGAKLLGGLTNLGNTCYMNATLEALRFVPELVDSLRTLATSAPESSERAMMATVLASVAASAGRAGGGGGLGGAGGGGADAALVPALGRLYDEMRVSNEDKPVRPELFLTILRAAHPTFAERSSLGGGMFAYKQQDSDEFTSALLTSLAKGLVASTPSLPRLLAPVDHSCPPNVIDTLLGVDFRVTLTCAETDAEPPVERLESGRKLVCNIQGGGGAEARVDHVHEGIRIALEGSVEKHSDVLGRNAIWNRKARIARLPKYVIVHFMRFYWKAGVGPSGAGAKCKILRPVAFPVDNFDLFEFCDPHVQAVLRANRQAHAERESSRLKATTRGMDADDAAGAAAAAAAEPSVDEAELRAAIAMSTAEGASDAAAAAAAAAGGGGAGAAAERPVLSPGVPSNFRGLYDCFAVVTHKGLSADSGHYIGWARQKGDQWLVFDDDEVSEVTSEHIKQLKGGGDHDMAYFAFFRVHED